MSHQNTSQRRDTLPGVNPGYFSRIPNLLISDLLLSLDKPWSDEAVRLYVYTLVGFGQRRFTVELQKGNRFTVCLNAGEFICSLRKLAKMSGRGRSSLQAIIGRIAEKARRTQWGGLPVYRLKVNDGESCGEIQDRTKTPAIAPETAVVNSPSEPPAAVSEPPDGHFRSRVDSAPISSKTSLINTPPGATSAPKSEPHKRENIIREKIKREKGIDSKTDAGHTAYDPKEKKRCGAVPIAEVLPVKKDAVSPASALPKTQALRWLVEFRRGISPDQLRTLMRRYGVTAEELDAACAGKDPVASPVSTNAAQ